MQKIKDLRNHAKGMGVKITYVKDGKRKYYTKKQLLEKIGKHTQGGSFFGDVISAGVHILPMLAGSMKKHKKHHKSRGGVITSDDIGDVADLVSVGVDAVAPELAPFMPLITDIAKMFGETSKTEYNQNYQLSAKDIAYIRANPEKAMQQMQNNPYMAQLMEQYFAKVGQQVQQQQEEPVQVSKPSTVPKPSQTQIITPAPAASSSTTLQDILASRKKTKGGKLIGLALPPQYQKMSAGALHDKHQKVKNILDKMSLLLQGRHKTKGGAIKKLVNDVKDRVMKPHLKKFYS